MQREVAVQDVMDDTYVGVNAADGLMETVELLLSEEAPVAVVIRGSEVVGGLADRDVLEALVAGTDPETATVADAMTEMVDTIRPNRSLAEARDRMTSPGPGWLVVTDGDQPLGIVTEEDLLAGSTLGREAAADVETEGVATAESTATSAGNETASEDSFDDQGICEVCGALTHDLAAFNGQLRCGDCRNL